jgi:hypothetical protein
MAQTQVAPAPTGRRQPQVRADHGPSPLSQVLARLGGFRGVLDGGLPPLVFVVAHAVAGSGHGLGTAIRAAGAAALVVVGVRLFRRETLRPVLGGLIGLAVAVTFAALAGDARAFFLPGIYVDAAYAVGFLASAVLGRPLVGTIYGVLFGRSWHADPRLRRLFAVATVGWSLVFALRAGVQGALYAADEPGLLAAAKLVLGWPLTGIAAALTLAAVSRAVGTRNGSRHGDWFSNSTVLGTVVAGVSVAAASGRARSFMKPQPDVTPEQGGGTPA